MYTCVYMYVRILNMFPHFPYITLSFAGVTFEKTHIQHLKLQPKSPENSAMHLQPYSTWRKFQSPMGVVHKAKNAYPKTLNDKPQTSSAESLSHYIQPMLGPQSSCMGSLLNLSTYHMGGCQNDGPFLDPYYNTAPNI